MSPVNCQFIKGAGVGGLDGFVAGEGADVVAVAGHLVGVDGSLGGEPGDETAGGIDATTTGDAFLDQASVFTRVVVEGRDAPMTLGIRGLLLHGEDTTVVVYLCHTRLMESSLVCLVVAHDARRVFLFRVADEGAQAEVQQVVTGHDE